MTHFQELLIKENASLKEAMALLDKTAKKIIFVIKSDGTFWGSLSDGDIRRWILEKGDLSASAGEVAYRNAYTVPLQYSKEEVKCKMRDLDIEYVPVLDQNKKIKEMLYYEHLFKHQIKKDTIKNLNIPVVIMAGGKGTRLDPFTKILPKPLIPIGDKTMLEIIIDKFLPYHVKNFFITLNYKSAIIKSYFEDIKPPYSITYIEENRPLGTAGPLKYFEEKISTPLLVTNCDIIIDADYCDIAEHHVKKSNDITMVTSVKHYNIPYGVCEIENGGDLLEIKEKPEYNFLINTGMYIINPEVLYIIPENEFYHITHLMEKVKISGGKVGVYPISEASWVDTGEWIEYKKAVEKLKI